MTELRLEVTPRWPVRLPRASAMDGVLRVRDGVVQRLLHVDGAAVVVRAVQRPSGDVLLGAQAPTRAAAAGAIARMRFALGLDDDLREFRARFASDPVIGPSVRARPWLRPGRRPEPFEALAWAIVEQLIEFERAAAIQRRIVRRLGACCPVSGLHDVPDASVLAAQAPALLASMDLAGGRALALVRAAREVARGRVDLRAGEPEAGWRQLHAIPGIGSWTVQTLALHGQGRLDQLPAGDLAYRKLVGRLLSGGDPRARASEEEVAAFFAPYAPWAGLAGAHALARHAPAAAAAVTGTAGAVRTARAVGAAAVGVTPPGRPGTRRSSRSRRWAVA